MEMPTQDKSEILRHIDKLTEHQQELKSMETTPSMPSSRLLSHLEASTAALDDITKIWYQFSRQWALNMFLQLYEKYSPIYTAIRVGLRRPRDCTMQF